MVLAILNKQHCEGRRNAQFELSGLDKHPHLNELNTKFKINVILSNSINQLPRPSKQLLKRSILKSFQPVTFQEVTG